MHAFLAQVRPWAEILYFASGLILAVAAILGLQQISLLKKSIRIRSDRAAKERAIEYAQRFLTVYTPLQNKADQTFRENHLDSFDGPIGDFTKQSLAPEYRDNAWKRASTVSWLAPMNELQSIAAAYITGVADECLGFEIIGRTFCHSVRSTYDLLAFCRDEPTFPHFQSVVDLYKLWAVRLQKAELSALRDHLTYQIGRIPDEASQRQRDANSSERVNRPPI